MGGPLDLALRTITLIFPTEELNDIIKIIKSLKDSGLLIKDFTETVKNEIKRQKKGNSSYVSTYIMQEFIRKYVSRKRCIKSRQRTNTAGKGTTRAVEWTIRTSKGTVRTSEGTIRAAQNF